MLQILQNGKECYSFQKFREVSCKIESVTKRTFGYLNTKQKMK